MVTLMGQQNNRPNRCAGATGFSQMKLLFLIRTGGRSPDRRLEPPQADERDPESHRRREIGRFLCLDLKGCHVGDL